MPSAEPSAAPRPPSTAAEQEAIHAAIKAAIAESPNARLVLRLHCLSLLLQDLPEDCVARSAGVSIRTLQRWAASWRLAGTTGLTGHPNSGRPSTLDTMALESIRAYVQQTGGRWTGERLRSLVAEQVGASLSLRQCQRMLRVVTNAENTTSK